MFDEDLVVRDTYSLSPNFSTVGLFSLFFLKKNPQLHVFEPWKDLAEDKIKLPNWEI